MHNHNYYPKCSKRNSKYEYIAHLLPGDYKGSKGSSIEGKKKKHKSKLSVHASRGRLTNGVKDSLFDILFRSGKQQLKTVMNIDVDLKLSVHFCFSPSLFSRPPNLSASLSLLLSLYLPTCLPLSLSFSRSI